MLNLEKELTVLRPSKTGRFFSPWLTEQTFTTSTVVGAMLGIRLQFKNNKPLLS